MGPPSANSHTPGLQKTYPFKPPKHFWTFLQSFIKVLKGRSCEAVCRTALASPAVESWIPWCSVLERRKKNVTVFYFRGVSH